MILHRLQKSRPAGFVVVAVGLFALGAAAAVTLARPTQSAQTPPAGQQAAGTDETLRRLMGERYEILKSIVESHEKLLAAGRMELAEWRDAKVELFAAKADLCQDVAGRIKVYEEMVDFLRSAEQLAQRRADSGLATLAEVPRARLATIEAQMTLERLRLGRTP